MPRRRELFSVGQPVSTWRRAAVGLAMLVAGIASLGSLGLQAGDAPQANSGPLELTIRQRVAKSTNTTAGSASSPEFQVVEKQVRWEPKQTALIICDMWDHHWCRGAEQRVAEIVPAMNRTVAAARQRGVLVIHAPSSCMAAYEGTPGRLLAQQAPKAANLPVDIGQWCRQIPAEERGVYPLDQSEGGCDCTPSCKTGAPWKRQIAGLDILPGDAISDSGVEIWNLLEQRGIDQIVLLGVHTNMCVSGRPFGLRNLSRYGKQVVLCRDLTDTMYNSRRWPYVNHHAGTALYIEHVEKYICPTITSSSLTGLPALALAPDTRLRIVMVIGEDEYQTETTLPAFAAAELEPRGILCTMVHADAKEPHNFPGMAAVREADLVLISVRRRAPTEEQLAELRNYLRSGRPLVGIRTASHAFDTKGKCPAGHAEWLRFDPEILGGNYQNHHPNQLRPQITSWPKAEQNPLLAGVSLPFVSGGSLYRNTPLSAAAVPLLMGSIDNAPSEPVAWTHQADKSRVFYTSLGHVDDFQQPGFRRLLLNGISWALNKPLPEAKPATGR